MAKFHLSLPVLSLAALGLVGCVGVPVAPSAYAPPSGRPIAQPAAYGLTCSAGVYTCTLPQQTPLGAPCACPGLGAPSYGNVR